MLSCTEDGAHGILYGQNLIRLRSPYYSAVHQASSLLRRKCFFLHQVDLHQSTVHKMLSLLIHIVLSHRPSYHVQSIVLLSSLFLYHHNFTMTLFSRINSINTNLIFLLIFTISLITISYLFFTHLNLLLECSTFSLQSSTRTIYLSHQQVSYLLYLLKTSSSFSLFVCLYLRRALLKSTRISSQFC
jgi:hypothetical protein